MARRAKTACGPDLPISTLRMQPERCAGVAREPVRSAQDAWAALRHAFSGCGAQERFVALHLDSKLRPIAVQEVSRGGLASTEVDPRVLFGGAVAVGARSLIVAHNHPTCELSPSPEDFALTERLRAAGKLLGVGVIDHLIACEGKNEARSIRETEQGNRLFQGAVAGAAQGGRGKRDARKRRGRLRFADYPLPEPAPVWRVAGRR